MKLLARSYYNSDREGAQGGVTEVSLGPHRRLHLADIGSFVLVKVALVGAGLPSSGLRAAAGYDDSNPPHLIATDSWRSSWMGIPRHPVIDPVADRLELLAQVTKQGPLLTKIDRRAVLSAVVRVIPTLKRWGDNGSEDTCRIVSDLLEALHTGTCAVGPAINPLVPDWIVIFTLYHVV